MHLLFLLAACSIDNGLDQKDAEDPGFDSGGADTDDTHDTDTVSAEDCNGVDDDGDGAVDEGFPDGDGNGRVDCLDLTCPELDLDPAGTVPIREECAASVLTEVTDSPWSARVLWQFDAPAVSPTSNQVAAHPVVGQLDDDNGDGVVDELDDPDVVVPMYGGPQYLVAIDGATGAEKWAVPGCNRSNPVIADVDADGLPEVVAANEAGYTIALAGADGATKWTSTMPSNDLTFFVITVADLDMDGQPEVIDTNIVMDGATGVTLWTMPADRYFYPYTMVAVGDVDQADHDQEVVFTGRVFDSDGTLLWETAEAGDYGMWPFLVQADTDPEAEIGFVGERLTLWDDDGSYRYRMDYASAHKQPGPPCVGDFDGDGTSELVFPAYDALLAYELDGTPLWSSPIVDWSGLAGCAGADLNGDGALEVLYADEHSVSFFDGRTGARLYTNTDHTSGTIFEYPVVADLDHDRSTEVVFVSDQYPASGAAVTALEHDGSGWAPAGSTWNAHDYTMTNIGDDGMVPADPEASWLEWNVYRARIPSEHLPRPDLVVSITDVCVMDCTYGPASVAISVANQGGTDVAAGTPVRLYSEDTTGSVLLETLTLPEMPVGTRIDGIVVDVSPADLGDLGFRAVVDDDGTGSDLVAECDEGNNVDTWLDTVCP